MSPTMNNSDRITCLRAPRQVNHIITSPAIKQECPEDSSITIPITHNRIVDSNDAPNDVDTDQSNNVGISLNNVQNEQALIDNVKEEYDDDEEEKEEGEYEEGELMSDWEDCKDCVKGICGLVGENDSADNDAETEVDEKNGFGKDEIEDQPNASLEHDLMVIPDVIDDSNQSSNNANDLSLSSDTSEQPIRSTRKSARLANQTQSGGNSEPVQQAIESSQQSLPSTSSGRRSSSRKRTQTKSFGGDHQSNGEVKSDKRNSLTKSTGKAVKKAKPQHGQIDHEDDVEDKEEEKVERKLKRFKILELNCTELGCNERFKCKKMFNQHLSASHEQHKAYIKPVAPNVPEEGYPCTKCGTVSESEKGHYVHWRNYHQVGKFQCSFCDFERKFLSEVINHQRKGHPNKLLPCTHPGCDKAFASDGHLKRHVRTHTGETPFKCIWDKCKWDKCFNLKENAIRHVRVLHFGLPRTVKEQEEHNIVDERDPNVFIEKIIN